MLFPMLCECNYVYICFLHLHYYTDALPANKAQASKAVQKGKKDITIIQGRVKPKYFCTISETLKTFEDVII